MSFSIFVLILDNSLLFQELVFLNKKHSTRYCKIVPLAIQFLENDVVYTVLSFEESIFFNVGEEQFSSYIHKSVFFANIRNYFIVFIDLVWIDCRDILKV